MNKLFLKIALMGICLSGSAHAMHSITDPFVAYAAEVDQEQDPIIERNKQRTDEIERALSLSEVLKQALPIDHNLVDIIGTYDSEYYPNQNDAQAEQHIAAAIAESEKSAAAIAASEAEKQGAAQMLASVRANEERARAGERAVEQAKQEVADRQRRHEEERTRKHRESQNKAAMDAARRNEECRQAQEDTARILADGERKRRLQEEANRIRARANQAALRDATEGLWGRWQRGAPLFPRQEPDPARQNAAARPRPEPQPEPAAARVNRRQEEMRAQLERDREELIRLRADQAADQAVQLHPAQDPAQAACQPLPPLEKNEEEDIRDGGFNFAQLMGLDLATLAVRRERAPARAARAERNASIYQEMCRRQEEDDIAAHAIRMAELNAASNRESRQSKIRALERSISTNEEDLITEEEFQARIARLQDALRARPESRGNTSSLTIGNAGIAACIIGGIYATYKYGSIMATKIAKLVNQLAGNTSDTKKDQEEKALYNLND